MGIDKENDMKETEKGTDGLNEQDVFLIKQNYFGKKIPLGTIADVMKLKLSQVIRAVQLNESASITFSIEDFDTGRAYLNDAFRR